jgi:DNA-binding beta-propeller fold protein YncE
MLALSIEKKRELRVFLRMLANTVGAVGLVAVLASCSTSPGYSYTIGGTVSGMVGSGMVLQNNGGDDRSISANGSFSFHTPLTAGTAYDITVKTQPTNPSQTCSVSKGSDTTNGAPVSNVVVDCVTGPTSVTVDPSGQFAYAANTDGTLSAYNIDSTYGTLQLLNKVTAGTYPTSVTVDPLKRGFAYAVDTIGGIIWAYTIETDGTLAALGTTVSAGAYPTSVTVDQSGQFVYVANMGDNTISVYTIDPTYGTLTVSGTAMASGKSPASIITVHLSVGEFVYVANRVTEI